MGHAQLGRSEARALLDEYSRRRSAPRLLRSLRAPRAVLETRWLKRTGRSRSVDLDTFWGGRFSGVLPEAVTIMVLRNRFMDEPVCHAMLDFLKPGDHFVDLGAHFGFFSLLASWLVGPSGRVLSLEAIPSTFEMLSNNVAKNASFANVDVVNYAAGDAEGAIEFSDFGVAFSSLNSAFGARGPMAEEARRNERKVVVPMKRAQDLLGEKDFNRVDFIKIDTESSEHLVLAGLAEILDRQRPLICMEMSDATEMERAHSDRLLSLLSSHGYSGWVRKDGAWRPFDVSSSIGYDNFVFFPNGRKPVIVQ